MQLLTGRLSIDVFLLVSLFFLILPVKGIPYSLAGQMAVVAYADGAFVQRTLQMMGSDRATPRLSALGSNARAYADEQVNELARQFNAHHEIDSYRAAIQAVVDGARQLEGTQLGTDMTKAIQEDMSDAIERALTKLFAELKAEFPAPDQALGHDERKAKIAEIMARARSVIVQIGVEHGLPEESMNMHLDALFPHIEYLIVLTGDIVEQHPQLISALLFIAAVAMVPEILILRPLLGLVGFGPYGPVKGSLAAWAQRVFFGAAVPKGSWFAYGQQAAMTFGLWGNSAMRWAGGCLAIIGGLFAMRK